MRYRVLASLALMSFVGAGAVPQVHGGAETIRFEPGDLALYQEDLSGAALGSQLEDWRLLSGSYEVAEFRGKPWLRPLDRPTRILRRMNLPQEFSIQFSVFLHAEAQPTLKLFAYTDRDLEREMMGPDGPAQLYLIVGRGYNPDHDWVHLRVWDPEMRRYRDVIRPNEVKFAPQREHDVAISVRSGQLHLFVDGTRVAFAPFRPDAPLTAVGFLFDAGSGSDVPYRDRAPLLDGIQIRAYTSRTVNLPGAAKLVVAVPSEPESLSGPLAELPPYLDDRLASALRATFGWTTVTLRSLPLMDGGMDSRGDPASWTARIRDLLRTAQQLRGGLVVVGNGTDGRTERERHLLSQTRALRLAALLASHGVGRADNLVANVAAKERGSEVIYYDPESQSYTTLSL